MKPNDGSINSLNCGLLFCPLKMKSVTVIGHKVQNILMTAVKCLFSVLYISNRSLSWSRISTGFLI
jgi:hypothetical protein